MLLVLRLSLLCCCRVLLPQEKRDGAAGLGFVCHVSIEPEAVCLPCCGNKPSLIINYRNYVLGAFPGELHLAWGGVRLVEPFDSPLNSSRAKDGSQKDQLVGNSQDGASEDKDVLQHLGNCTASETSEGSAAAASPTLGRA